MYNMKLLFGFQVRWERISPGNNVSHSVVVRPRAVGTFNHSSALITYYPNEDAKEVRVSYTTAPGEGIFVFI